LAYLQRSSRKFRDPKVNDCWMFWTNVR
jgi:hypothetical protein